MRATIRELLRSLRVAVRRPRVAFSFVLPLALALAGGTVMFAMVRGVILEPLPFMSPERLVQIWERNTARGDDQTRVAVADFYDWQNLDSFSSVAGYLPPWDVVMSGTGDPHHIRAATGTYNLFDTLGLAPVAGRLYTSADEAAGEEIIVVSSEFANELFGSPQAAVGRSIELEGDAERIIGVIEPGRSLPLDHVDVFAPIAYSDTMKANRKSHVLQVVARLKPDVSVSAAQAELDVMMARIRADFHETKTGEQAYMIPLHDEIVGDTKAPLMILTAAVAILLLIAVANVSGVAVARVRSRARELAVRRSLGASSLRASLPIVAETAMLSVLSGFGAIALAAAGLRMVVTATADWVPRVRYLSLGGVDAAACFAAALLAGGAIGLVSMLIAFRSQDPESLRGFGNTAGRVTRDRLRAGAVVAQVAMSFVLLSGAAVLVRSMIHLLTIDVGYESESILTADFELPSQRYKGIDAQSAFFRDVVARVEAVPGVESAAATSAAPVTGSRITRSFLLDGEHVGPEGARRDYPYSAVTPGYFETMSIPILRGRAFDETDSADAPGVIIVNEAFVRRESPNRDVVDRRISFEGESGPWLKVVGVVADTREAGPESDPEPRFFVPHAQRTWTWLDWGTLVVRTNGDPARLVSAVRNAVRSLEPSLPVDEVLTVEQHIADSLARKRFQLLLIATFAVLALVLTVVGIYALIANALAMRMREVGVRLALGAGPRDVVGLFTREGMTLVSMGVALGLVLSSVLMRFLDTMVVRVSPNDPLSISAAVVLLLGITALSCYLPSRRATRVDPAIVLRAE